MATMTQKYGAATYVDKYGNETVLHPSTKTDMTLSKPGIPADALAVKLMLDKILSIFIAVEEHKLSMILPTRMMDVQNNTLIGSESLFKVSDNTLKISFLEV